MPCTGYSMSFHTLGSTVGTDERPFLDIRIRCFAGALPWRPVPPAQHRKRIWCSGANVSRHFSSSPTLQEEGAPSPLALLGSITHFPLQGCRVGWNRHMREGFLFNDHQCDRDKQSTSGQECQEADPEPQTVPESDAIHDSHESSTSYESKTVYEPPNVLEYVVNTDMS